ncbi:intermembrane transport protein PqiB [Candidatus Hamiltonella defensa]|uniref:Paraquat-inducible protein B n=1 Tax=Candidatus Williamhamiltonella defendens TaxID=138072 RepID=A0AAC9YGC3_9ENTR|nr:intermembrane transport protein PqiB [Candidatus Hamiltonella defensa]ASV33253.1 paraquat-inducible protein B [Candidatus Hamiltonella defensa]AWK16212.1 paraquat-inducible protein B [Candidatus Hamiltonella defensa]MBK4362014.1 intermembrane transport protein PqiB [Candidatus Hamiltonella defensa]
MNDLNPDSFLKEAEIEKIRRWSPVWIIPIVTILIGAWILFYHFSHLGQEVSLVTYNAEGIQAGKTKIKSRNVDVGMVEKVVLSRDLNHVIIKARLYKGMENLLRKDSVFWVIKPEIGRAGVSGLSTLLSGAYVELRPGIKGAPPKKFELLTAPPLASPDAKGIRILLYNDQDRQINPGDPVLFRGYRVGSVETSHFDVASRLMNYQLFINSPYDSLVTTNVRFWQDSGIALDLSSQGMRVEISSLLTLFGGGVSFDVPKGLELGEPVNNKTQFQLFDSKASIQNSLYAEHKDFLLFFPDSIRGLQSGAPVEFRGVRVGTVSEAPFFFKEAPQPQPFDHDFHIPVLIKIEPARFKSGLGKDINLKMLKEAEQNGLRAALKSGNLITGALFVDLDFYPNAKPWKEFQSLEGYPLLPTVSGGTTQIQQKVNDILDKINQLAMEPALNQFTQTLVESQKTMQKMQKTLTLLNEIMGSKGMKNLPETFQKTLHQLSESIKGFEPGSQGYHKMMGNLQGLNDILRELQPLLRTLNTKSNALIFQAPPSQDPQPMKAKK